VERQALLSLNFKHYISEDGMYTCGNTERRLIMGVYVDDLIITGSSM
jgi:hypothetical protein